MNLSAFSDVETQISKIKIENEVDSLKNYISLQGRVQIHFFKQSELTVMFGHFLRFRKNYNRFFHFLQIVKIKSKNSDFRKNMNSMKS